MLIIDVHNAIAGIPDRCSPGNVVRVTLRTVERDGHTPEPAPPVAKPAQWPRAVASRESQPEALACQFQVSTRTLPDVRTRARRPPRPFSAASAPGPKASSIQ